MGGAPYPKYIEKLILNNAAEHTLSELTVMCRAADTSREYKEEHIRRWLSARGLKARCKSHFEHRRSILTQEQHEFFVEHNTGRIAGEMAKLMNETFALNLTPTQVKAYRHNNHLPCGVDTKFKKGHVTGPISPETRARLQKSGRESGFKKGHVPHNTASVGTVVERDGYLWIKTAEPGAWRSLAKVIWEKTHGKPFPEKMDIKFIDNDPMNVDPDNLIAMSRSEGIMLMHRGWTRKGTTTGAAEKNTVRLICTIREKKRQLSKREKTDGHSREDNTAGDADTSI